LRLSSSEFGELTPALFDALLKRKEESIRLEFTYAGVVAAAIYNAAPFGEANRKALSPLEFVPGEKKKPALPDLTEMSPDQQAAYVLSIFSRAKYTERKRR
jgi:hypothetical protein